MTDTRMNAAYMVIGFLTARRLNKEQYEIMADKYGGESGVVDRLLSFAPLIDAWDDKLTAEEGFVGVWHYEIVEAFGMWLYENLDSHTDAAKAFLDEMITAWINDAKITE